MLNLSDPRKILIIRVCIYTVAAIIAVIYYFSEAKPFNYTGYEKNIDRIARYNAELDSSIVQIQFGLLKDNYPTIIARTGIHDAIGELKKDLEKNPNKKIEIQLKTLEEFVTIKDSLVHDFNSINPALIHAINQFSKILADAIESQASEELVTSTLSSEQKKSNGGIDLEANDRKVLIDKINELFRSFLIYTNFRSEEHRSNLVNMIQDIQNAPKPKNFPDLSLAINFANQILMLQPKMSQINKDLSEIPVLNALNALTEAYKGELLLYQNRAHYYRFVLYALLFVLLIMLRSTFSRLLEINRQLEKRVLERTQELTEKNENLNRVLTHLKDAQDQLIIQEKMASVGMLTTGIAHEIKNPLNFINNFSELSIQLLRELKPITEAHESKFDPNLYLEIQDMISDLVTNSTKVLEHGRRADNIIKSMLLHSQETSTQKEMVDLNSLTQEQIRITLESFTSAQGKLEIQLDKEYDPNLPRMLIAPQALGRVLSYIIDNALYAMKQRLKRSPEGYVPRLSVQIKQEDNQAIIKIMDNGTGIPKPVLDRIFEPFYTTKPTGKGNTGLGLSIAYDTVIKQFKGAIKVASEEGNFTEFTITLPYLAPEADMQGS